MIRFLADECLNPKPVAALRDCVPPVDIATVTDVGLRTAADPMILTWAAEA